MTDYSEYNLIEKPAIALFETLGWQTADCFHETCGEGGILGRDNRSEVVLVRRLKAAIDTFNEGISPEA